MRAVAVVLVLLCHAGLAAVSGGFVGVDVFFVISGFLITGLLVDELARTGRISLVGFYARRAKRLLPAAALVLLASLALTWLFLPRTRWSSSAWDVVASAVYGLNWRLADRAVDYFAIDQAPSIVQHYWSLAVEEQFYLLWPVLIIGVCLLGRRRWHRLRAGAPLVHRVPTVRLLLGLAVVGVPSLLWSLRLTGSEPARAYFVTTTRLWELALGGCLALLGTSLARLPRLVAAALAWGGLAAVVASALLFTSDTAFPGVAALAPTLGTAGVLAGGCVPGRFGPGRLLGVAPMRAVGALSYSLYLWHWPLLVAATAQVGALSQRLGLAVVAASTVPAVLTYRLLENPVRRSAALNWSPGLALRVGAACTGLALLGGLAFQFTVWPPAQSGARAGLPSLADPGEPDPVLTQPGAPGAMVLSATPRGDQRGAPVDRVDRITPDPLAGNDDYPQMYRDKCDGSEGRDRITDPCVYGDPAGRFTVALTGDSHAAQWSSPLAVLAAKRHWRLVPYTMSSCPFVRRPVSRPADGHDCTGWNARLLAALTGGHRPDLVITSSSNYVGVRDGKPWTGPDGAADFVRGLHETWSALDAAGVPVLVLRDTPQPGFPMADCVAAHRSELTRCAVDRAQALRNSRAAQEAAAAGLPRLHTVDLADAICPTDRCAPVIGGVLVYRDSNHLTETYALSLTPRLDAALTAALR